MRRLLTLGRVPALCLVVIVDAESGTLLERNPFNFYHHNVSKCEFV